MFLVNDVMSSNIPNLLDASIGHVSWGFKVQKVLTA